MYWEGLGQWHLHWFLLEFREAISLSWNGQRRPCWAGGTWSSPGGRWECKPGEKTAENFLGREDSRSTAVEMAVFKAGLFVCQWIVQLGLAGQGDNTAKRQHSGQFCHFRVTTREVQRLSGSFMLFWDPPGSTWWLHKALPGKAEWHRATPPILEIVSGRARTWNQVLYQAWCAFRHTTPLYSQAYLKLTVTKFL